MPLALSSRLPVIGGLEQRRAGAVEPFDEGHQPALVVEARFDRRGVPLVAQRDVEAGIEESEFPQAPFENGVVEFDLGEGPGARLEDDFGAVGDRSQGPISASGASASPCWKRIWCSVLSRQMRTSIHSDKCVHNGGADAMQAARNLVGILVELAAGMQPRQHQFGG